MLGTQGYRLSQAFKHLSSNAFESKQDEPVNSFSHHYHCFQLSRPHAEECLGTRKEKVMKEAIYHLLKLSVPVLNSSVRKILSATFKELWASFTLLLILPPFLALTVAPGLERRKESRSSTGGSQIVRTFESIVPTEWIPNCSPFQNESRHSCIPS